MADQPKERSTLADILNYEPEQLLSKDEMALIGSVLNANPTFIKILRKVLLPSVVDPDMPIEQLTNDVWLAGLNYAQIPESDIKPIVLARQDMIKTVMSGLTKLKVIAAAKPLTKQEQEARAAANSSK